MTRKLANPGRRGVPKDGSRNPGWANRRVGWAHMKTPPASGEGWGGQASGAPKREAFNADNQPPVEWSVAGKMENKDFREKLRERLGRVLGAYDAALDSDNPAHGLQAADAITKRLFGDYKQTVETQADTRTDDEIRADIERRRKELGL